MDFFDQFHTKLADLPLVGGQHRKSRAAGLKSLARQNRTVRFKLHTPVPVFLEYYTATVGPDQVAKFHPDIYDYDYAALVKPIGKMKPPTVW